jgi:hypothetical protein
MPSWTDPNLTTATNIRAIHINEAVTYLNNERTRRGLSTISLNVSAAQTKVLTTHLNTIRSTIDNTPLTVGCSANHSHRSYNSGVDSSNRSYYTNYNSTVYSSQKTWYYGTNNGSARFNYALGSGNCAHECTSY